MDMRFKIDEQSKLTIVDDNRETIIGTDKADLRMLKEAIESHLGEGEENSGKGMAYGYNPRTRRIELLGR